MARGRGADALLPAPLRTEKFAHQISFRLPWNAEWALSIPCRHPSVPSQPNPGGNHPTRPAAGLALSELLSYLSDSIATDEALAKQRDEAAAESSAGGARGAAAGGAGADEGREEEVSQKGVFFPIFF